MDSALWWAGVGFVVLVCLSALLSASEAAFFSLSRLNVDRMKEEDRASTNKVLSILRAHRRLLATFLVAGTLATTGAACLALVALSGINARFPGSQAGLLALEVVALGFVLLVFGQIIPRAYGLQNAEKVAAITSTPIRVISGFLYPATRALAGLTDKLNVPASTHFRTLLVTEEDLRTLVDAEEEKGELEAEEKEMIQSIFEFGQKTVKEVMVPRIDMVCLDSNATLGEMLQAMHEEGHSRIPIYEGTVDNIVGIIYARDLLRQAIGAESAVRLTDLARQAHFVPQTKKIDELLREFRREKVHMAIVVDEYGGTAGLVTLEDLLEEIVGEIQDEYDVEEPLFAKIDEHTIVADAKMDIHDLNELFNVNLATDGFETLGGLIYKVAGRVPEQGEALHLDNLQFIVQEVAGQRISKVKVVKRPEEPPDSEPDNGREP